MRRTFAVLATLLLVLTLAPVSSGTVHDTGKQFRVFLQPDGDATVEVYTEYDLSNESQRTRFNELVSNETAQNERRVSFRRRLDLGQVLAESATGRGMAVGDVSLNTTRENDTGVVRLTALWANLATVDPGTDQLTITAPFGNDRFRVNRTLVVFGPEGFTRTKTTPPPDREVSSVAYWDEGTDLAEFTVAFSGPVATPTPTSVTSTPTVTPAPVTVAGLMRLFTAVALAAVPAVAVAVVVARIQERE